MKTYYTLFIFFLTISITHSNAQPTFQRHYGGAYNDGAASVVATSDGCYVTAGYTQSFGHGGWDIYLVKTNTLGDTLWTKTIGGTADEKAAKIIETSDHNLVIIGVTHSFTYGGFDIFLVKTTLEGEVLWMKNYGGDQDDGGNSIIETTDGDFVIAATAMSYVTSGGFCSSYVLKVNSQGDSLWSKTFAKKSANYISSVFCDIDNNIVLSGYTSEMDNIADVYVIKLNQAGDSLWTRIYDLGASEQVYWSCETNAGDYIFAGQTKENGYTQALIMKVATNGTKISHKTYGGEGNEFFSSGVYIQGESNLVLTGETSSFGVYEKDVYMMKISENGDSIWQKTYGWYGEDWAANIIKTSDGGFMLCGYYSVNTNNWDVYLLKTQADGYAGIENPVPGTQWNIYPNPCHDQLNLETQISITGASQVYIYNEQGQAVLQQTIQSPAETINTSALKPGIYLLKIINSRYSESRRLVKLN